MVGILKVGRTNSPPTKRLGELHTTGVPAPFILEACFHVIDPIFAEKRIHAILDPHRLSKDREFFTVSVSEALSTSLPVVSEFLVNGQTPMHSTSTGISRLDGIEEEILLFISTVGGYARAYEYGIQEKFSLSQTRSTFLLGRLVKRSFIRARRHERHMPYFEIEHDGIQYLLDHQILKPGEL